MEPSRPPSTIPAAAAPTTALTGFVLGLLVASYFLRYINSNLQGPLLVDLAREFSTSVAMVGQIAVAITLPWGLAAPLLGPFSDRYGRRPLLLIGLALAGVSSALTALAWDYPSLLFFRFLAGVGGAASAPTAIAIIGDLWPVEKRGRPLGLLFGGEAVGALVGLPLITLVAGAFGWKAAFLVEGALYVPIVLAFLLLAPTPRWAPHHSAGWAANIRGVLSVPSISWLLLLNGLVQVSFFAVATFLPAYLMQTYHLSVTEVAPALLVMAAGNLLGAVGGGPVAERFARHPTYALVTLIASILALILMILTTNLWLSIVLAAAFHGLHAAGRPVYTCIISEASVRLRGTVLGVNATSNNVGTAAGSALGGAALGLVGYAALGWVALLISLIPAVGLPLLGRRSRPTATD